MTKNEFKEYIDMYRNNLIHIKNYKNNAKEFENIISNYEYMLRLLSNNTFGEIGSDLIEEYLYKQRQMSFDALWNKLNEFNSADRK